MIINDATYQLRDLLRSNTLPLVEVADLPQQLTRMVSGQRVQAQVVALLQNGRFQTQIAGAAVELNLPPSTQPGDQVDLTFVGAEPRPTFQFNGILKPVSTSTGQVNLSTSGQLLAQLNSKPSGGQSAQAQPLVHTTPVISSPPQDPSRLADALRTALGESGFFYESHQAEWITGQRPLAQLMREPQARPGEVLVVSQSLGMNGNSVSRPMVQPAVNPLSQPLPATPVLQPVPATDLADRPIPAQSGANAESSAKLPAGSLAFDRAAELFSPAVRKADQQSSQSANKLPQATGEVAVLAAPDTRGANGVRAETPVQHQSGPARDEYRPIPAKAESTQTSKETVDNVKTSQVASAIASSIPQGVDTDPPIAQQLMNQQMGILDTRQVVWQGQVWPGQTMRWTIEEDSDAEQDGSNGGSEEKPWHTSVNMSMPELGSVAARLSLTGKNVRLQIGAVDEKTAELMRGRLLQLEKAYAASGLKLQQVVVKHEPKA